MILQYCYWDDIFKHTQTTRQIAQAKEYIQITKSVFFYIQFPQIIASQLNSRHFTCFPVQIVMNYCYFSYLNRKNVFKLACETHGILFYLPAVLGFWKVRQLAGGIKYTTDGSHHYPQSNLYYIITWYLASQGISWLMPQKSYADCP